MNPWLADPDFTLYVGDALDVLRGLPDGSVDCCVTSPPYWGLRDYGAAGQLGLEATPDEYVARMVAVFREVRRVLADHGTCWVNLGDSYASNGTEKSSGNATESRERGMNGAFKVTPSSLRDRAYEGVPNNRPPGLKPKDLCGIPWRVAFALQADGWYLRSDVVWAKPNPMPESVTDRPTKAHEYVFLLSKRSRYWFDAEAVREPAEYGYSETTNGRDVKWRAAVGDASRSPTRAPTTVKPGDGTGGRNVRSVWEIATQPYPEAHFATFPEELPRRCILAGCPEWVCWTCGKPRERLVETNNPSKYAADDKTLGWANTHSKTSNAQSSKSLHRQPGGVYSTAKTVGWSDCGHQDYRPGVVLDPFLGSGTTALVARNHGRHTVGIELSPEYAQLAARRLQQLSLLAEGAL